MSEGSIRARLERAKRRANFGAGSERQSGDPAVSVAWDLLPHGCTPVLVDAASKAEGGAQLSPAEERVARWFEGLMGEAERALGERGVSPGSLAVEDIEEWRAGIIADRLGDLLHQELRRRHAREKEGIKERHISSREVFGHNFYEAFPDRLDGKVRALMESRVLRYARRLVDAREHALVMGAEPVTRPEEARRILEEVFHPKWRWGQRIRMVGEIGTVSGG